MAIQWRIKLGRNKKSVEFNFHAWFNLGSHHRQGRPKKPQSVVRVQMGAMMAKNYKFIVPHQLESLVDK